ncbi:uncharacterized protein LOC128960406 [Oppia nitens]|uniref:uncharacterized protein LOC128960406 n=1 Tax=Oppia nitens TaxID=1686743 RepID=UPI0023DC5F8A|nr:uncharacterized protein LOC128960406 [Oppia nitens]
MTTVPQIPMTTVPRIPLFPYFCIFIDQSVTDSQQSVDMRSMYTTADDCFLTFRTRDLLRNHLLVHHLVLDTNITAVNKFIDSHLEYQDQLIVCMSENSRIPGRNQTLYDGCPLCDRIIIVFSGIVQGFYRRNINSDWFANNVVHINRHIKYFPYECLDCKKITENHKEMTVCEKEIYSKMKQHIVEQHLRTARLTESELYTEVDKRVLKLEINTLDDLVSDEELGNRQNNNSVVFYYCLFCYKKYVTKKRAIDHYIKHMMPYLVCTVCAIKFKTFDDYRHHNSDHLGFNEYILNDYTIKRKWINKFINYINSYDIKMTTCALFQHNCLVCQFVVNVLEFPANGQPSTATTISGDILYSHIHNHLQYLPFECIDCDLNYNNKTEFCLDSIAEDHIRQTHNPIITDSQTMLKRYLRSNNCIEKFDQIIDKSVKQYKQTNEYMDYN